MIVGKKNYIPDNLDTLSRNGVTEYPGQGVNNVLGLPSLQAWKSTDNTDTVTIEFTGLIDIQLIGLFYVVADQVIIKCYDDLDVLLSSKTILKADFSGIDFKDCYDFYTAPVSVKKIELVFTKDATAGEIICGYVWAGGVYDFGCSEKIYTIYNSTDQTTITRGNAVDIQKDYAFREIRFTTKKEYLSILRTNILDILRTGYSAPRPVLINEPNFAPGEFMLGIFDSGKFQIDVFSLTDQYNVLSQTVTGIREVF